MRLNVRTACRQSSDSGLDRDAQKNRSVSLSDLFEAYLSSKPNLSHIHQDQIRYVLERLRKANLAALAVSEIEPSKLEPVLSEMKGGTKNRYLRILRAAFNYAIKHDWMKANPTDKLDFASIPKRSIRIFSNRQIEDMLRYSAEHHIDMLPYFALGAGLRVGSGELSKMEWSDIHWEEKTIVVRPEISKTGKRRLIPLCDALNSWLTLYLEKRKVTSRRIITIPYGTLRKLRSRIFEAVSPNSRWIAAGLRHSFCSASINAEKGIDATCLSMGYQGSPTKRCGSALWRNVLSIVRKSWNSSGGLYRCRRRSAHNRRRTNAVRFLMKTLRARPASRLIHAFRQKPLWWIRSTAPLSSCPGKPGLGHLGDCRDIHGAHTPFGKSSILLFKPATTASRVSLNPSSP